ncbi:MAG: MBL fold metallo-hydrolase [Candidatus Paceibacterota bacterium]
MKLHFLGGAESVTGSNYLLEHEGKRILIDCGMFQGDETLEQKNAEPLPFDVHTIDAVFITHAHIDHIGRVPLLVKNGYHRSIYSTAPAKDEAYELLLDAYTLMTHKYKGDINPPKPLFEISDIDDAMTQWDVIAYHQTIHVGPFEVTYYDAGHILGSASVVVQAGGVRVGFSGDLGNVPAPLVKDTEYLPAVDYALIESTYGGRLHPLIGERKEKLRTIIQETVAVGGTVLIPAFAMERTQELLYELNELVEHKRIPEVPIFIDSPLAIKMTSVYKKYLNNPSFVDSETRGLVKSGDEIFDFTGLNFTVTTEESKKINSVPPPKIIIAGSGMSNGGRVLHHELRYLSDPQSTIIFVGYQPDHSIGRRIIDGAQEVSIMGDVVSVRARVEVLGGYSAHADQPLLLKWIQAIQPAPKTLFVVQGDSEEQKALQDVVIKELKIQAIIPKAGEVVDLV